LNGTEKGVESKKHTVMGEMRIGDGSCQFNLAIIAMFVQCLRSASSSEFSVRLS